jgi:ammonia channel protein AmtB
VRAAGYSNLNSACARGEQFGVQIVGSLAIMSWASVTSGIILGIMRLVGLDLRVETDIEVCQET